MDSLPGPTPAPPQRAYVLVMQPASPGAGWHALLAEPAGRTWQFDSLAGLVRFLVTASGLQQAGAEPDGSEPATQGTPRGIR